MGHKGEQKEIHDACIVRTVDGKKARMSSDEATLNGEESSLIHCRVKARLLKARL